MHQIRNQVTPRALALAIAAALAPAAVADEVRLPRIDVVGESEQDVAKQPGSVAIVTKEALELQQPHSTEEALKAVPGVVIKPEEETAIVANIGLRGLSAADYKSLILEDGVPVAPGLFVGNGRYYNPRIQRMESIEVLKGAASLRYGPNTIGGVINYKTKQPEDGFSVAGRAGSFGYREAVIEAGGSAPSGEASGGVVYTRASSDGFQRKGFDMEDLMVKGGMAIGDNQWVGIKFTHYENDANISYRGLFLDDYKKGETYNPAPDDWFLTGRKSVDLNHEWEISSNAHLNTVLYWSEMYRDYWRYSVENAASVAAGRWVYTDALAGNNRSFERNGIDSRLHITHNSFGMQNDTELGVRVDHESMNNRRINATRDYPRSGTLASEVIESASSVAIFVQNRFVVSDRLAVTPGLRVESYEQETNNLKDDAKDGRTNNTEVMPGIGATLQITPRAQLYGGVYKAFAPAQNADAISGGEDQRLKAERSMNYEIGVRGASERMRYEFTAFRMDFSNQVIPSNSGGYVKENGGKTLHQGLEGAFGYDFDSGFSVDVNATYVPEAKFIGDRYSGATLAAADGNRITYTPELAANLILAYRSGGLKTALHANYVGAQYTDTLNTDALVENTSGFFTGKLAAYTTVDLSAQYAVNKQLSVSAAVKNLTDERYIASLRQGIYAGPSRSFELGAKYKF
ncbi:MAG: TonB-dependent receptor [Thiohalomonadaceae bacterium]